MYPTSSNTITTARANYNDVIRNTTPVGSYAANYYGTFDMGGNVWEWNEAIIFGSYRGVRGGSFFNVVDNLRADNRNFSNPTIEYDVFGFRVSQVPGPGSVALLAIGGLGALRRRRGVGR
jgi:MYXO-CTERM domain-containing protein